jgi:hypothetical protein
MTAVAVSPAADRRRVLDTFMRELAQTETVRVYLREGNMIKVKAEAKQVLQRCQEPVVREAVRGTLDTFFDQILWPTVCDRLGIDARRVAYR